MRRFLKTKPNDTPEGETNQNTATTVLGEPSNDMGGDSDQQRGMILIKYHDNSVLIH